MALTLLPVSAMADETPSGGGESTPVETPAVKTTTTGNVTYSDNDAKIENLVYTNGTMTVTGANVTIENVTFGDGAALKVNTSGNFTLKNCTFNGKTDVRTPVTLNVGSATVTGNTFNGTKTDGTPTYYNAIEFAVSSGNKLSSATLSNNIFEAAIKNNYFSTYYYADNAVITAENNVIKLANRGSNAIRISNVTNSDVTFNLNNNSYTYVDNTSDYEGFILLQDFTKKSGNAEDFSKVTINISNLTSPSDASRLFYVWEDSVGLVSDNNPVIKGDSSIEKFFAAKVGDTYYKTLAEAVAAADNATVTLLKDVAEKVSISKNLVLDLNGKTLTGEDLVNSNGKNERIALTANAGEVKVKNGIIDGRVNAYDSADLTIDADVTVKNSYNGSGYDCFGIVVWGDGTFGQDGCKTPKLTVNGKVIMEKGGVAISTNGNDKSCAIVTINNGAVISTTEDGAIYLPSGKLTMNGGTVSGPTGIQICAGSTNITSDFKLHNGTVIATGADERTSKGTGDGLIPDGAAISVVNRNYPNGVPNVTIDGGSFSSANSDAVLAYSWSNGTASGWTDAKTYVKINDGYFTSDPTAYLAAGKYVIKSDKAGYTYAVTGTKPEKTPIFVDENTTYDTSAITDETTKNAINAVINKAKVEGVAAAVDESALVASKVDASEVDAAKKVDVEVSVKVEVKSADLSGENAAKTLTFEAKPVATIKVDGAVKATDVPVPNSLLSGEITVKLPLPTGFTPKQILHKFTGGGYEYFINKDEGSKRGAGSFKIEDGCAVFTIYGFSTFELSGTVTYVAPSSGGGSSSSSRRYDVSAPSVKHGDVTVSPKTASKGDTVTITVKPDSGYELDTLTVKDASGSKIKVKDKGDGKFTFTMPASKVTVSAEFAEIETLDFADVSTDAYYYEAVKWAAKKGITGGTGDGNFNPNGSCTRAHIVTFLWRAAGSPEPKSTVSFADVPADSYYAKAVAWAVENGITLGTGDGTFSPNATCTRAQSVTFLYRALGTAPTTVNGFTDVTADAFYADAVAWAVESGVTNGTSASTFSPNNGCTRAQIVTFLYRTMK